jgi:hypothetical protein
MKKYEVRMEDKAVGLVKEMGGTVGYENYIEIFVANLITVRTARGYNPVGLSRSAGLKDNRVHDIEERRTPPKLVDVIMLCKELDVSIDDMLNKTVTISFKF